MGNILPFPGCLGSVLLLLLLPIVPKNSLPIQTLAAEILVFFLPLLPLTCQLGNTFLSSLTSQSLWTFHLINIRIECYSGVPYASLSAPATPVRQSLQTTTSENKEAFPGGTFGLQVQSSSIHRLYLAQRRLAETNIGKHSTNRRRNKRLSVNKKCSYPPAIRFCSRNFSYNVMTVDYFSPHRHRSYIYQEGRFLFPQRFFAWLSHMNYWVRIDLRFVVLLHLIPKFIAVLLVCIVLRCTAAVTALWCFPVILKDQLFAIFFRALGLR